MRVIRAGKKRSGTTTAGGQQRGSVYLGEQKVQVDVPRVRNVFLSPFVTHHNAKYFNDPEQVVPEHWSKDNRAKLPPGSYLPYGRGDRTCIGIRLAQLIGAGVIANVSSKWEFELDPQQKIDISPWLTLQPRYGMRMIPKRRVG